VLIVALLTAGCATITGNKPGYPVTVEFRRGVSLYSHSSVRVLGLPAGRVTSIKTEGDRVKVTLSVDNDIKLPTGVQAAIVPQSLIGERYVQLFPAWTDGKPTVKAGEVIPLERTSIPVEPDEALAALKKFLDSLDPKATGQLVHNLADDLRGNGQSLNDAIKGLAQVSSTLADKDTQLADILSHFDKLTATLDTRQQALGKVLDQFSVATKLLADERKDIEGLLQGLGTVSKDGLDLVSAHRVQLDQDLNALTGLLQSLSANIDSVRNLLDSAPTLVAGPDLTGKNAGLAAAYDPKYHHLDLRNEASTTASRLLAALGLPGNQICLPIDVNCQPSAPAVPRATPAPTPTTAPSPAPTTTTTARSTTTTAPTLPPLTVPVTGATVPPTVLPPVTVPPSPFDGILGLMASTGSASISPGAAPLGAPGSASVSHGLGWLRGAARFLLRALP
jgi:phospholipid/cholesterol/gamma-HCH transport system substrate-binding protein